MRCWSDDYNHCRSCHALIETLKHYRFKSQYCMTLGSAPRGDVFRVNSYLDCPVGVQINVLIFLIPIKDFIWSQYHYLEQMRMKQLSIANSQISGTASSSTCLSVSDQGHREEGKILSNPDGLLQEHMDDEAHNMDMALDVPEA